MGLLNHARAFAKHHYSIIATDERKRPAILSWKKYQAIIATGTELEVMFNNSRAQGIGIICGAVSKNLEVIDIDCKNDFTGTLFNDYIQALTDANMELATKLLIAKTINKGYHIYYRCNTIEGNKKLASRETTPEERENNPHEKVLVLIETRGEGGYVIAAPTNGYEYIQNTPTACPEISESERAILLETARSFNQWQEKPMVVQPAEPQQYSLSPFDDYNKRGDIISLLQKHGWAVVKETTDKVIVKRPGNTESKSSGDYNKKLGWFSVFTTSSQFTPNKAYLPYAVYALLECNNDFSKASRQLLDEGFGKYLKKIDKKAEGVIRQLKKENVTDEEIVYALVHRVGGITKTSAAEMVADYNANAGEKIATFWEVNPENLKISIVRTKIEKFLHEQGGFSLYYFDKKSNLFKIIRNENGLIEEASTEQMKKFIKAYILNLPGNFDNIRKEDLLEVIYKGHHMYFTESFFEFLDRAEINFLKDKKDTAYFPFKNGVVAVTKDGCKLCSYGKLKKHIWQSQVVNHHINLYNPDDIEPGSIYFYRFICKICNDNAGQIEYCMAIIGYLLHKFKTKSNTFSIALTEDTDDESKGGGTGKGIFIQALSYLINTERIDGKNFKLDKNFAFQRVKLDTKLIAIDDIRKRIDFEGFYSIITEGITIEKKNKDELYIPYEDAPKIIFSTNYTIPVKGNHGKRRLKVLEFGQFFKDNLPINYFGHQLFDDWDEDEWNRFYNFMFCCIQEYLKNGIPNNEMKESTKRKEIKTTHGEEFLNWWDEYFDTPFTNYQELRKLYEAFLSQHNFDKKEYSQRRFKKAMEDTAELLGYEIKTKKDRHGSNVTEIKIVKPILQETQKQKAVSIQDMVAQ